MSVLHSPPCERRSSHSQSDIISTNNSSLSNQPLAVRSSGIMPARANKTTKEKELNNIKPTALPTAALSAVTTNTSTTTKPTALPTAALSTATTNTSTTTTAATSTTTTTALSVSNSTCIMSMALNTRTNAIGSNAQKEMQIPKRTRSSPEKAPSNANKKPKQQSTKQQQLTYWLSRPPTENRFDILAGESDLEELTNNEPLRPELNQRAVEKNKIPKPPPINVQNVQYLSTLIKALNESIQNNYELKVLNNTK